MKFVRFKRPDNSQVWVNPNCVVSVSVDDGKVRLLLGGGLQQVVLGDIEWVLTALEGDEQ
jgi:hypothetical protein